VPLAFALLIALLQAAHAGSTTTSEARAAEPPAVAPPGDTTAEPGPQHRRVLALFWYGPDHPVTSTFDRQFQAVLKQQEAGDVVRYAEYLEPGYVEDESQAHVVRDYLRRKYADRKIDVLFCWGSRTLGFLLESDDPLFSKIPIVYYSSSLEAVKHLPAPPMTGVLNPDAYANTLELALRLHPDTTEAFVISGTVNHDKSIEREAAPQLAKFQDRVKVTYLTDLPLGQLIATVRGLPKRSVILYSRQSHEDPDRVLQPFDFLDPISRAAPVPVYAPWRSHVGSGVVGGVVEDPVAGAAQAADMVVRVARGARPRDIAPGRVPTTPTFDARQLVRFEIDEDRLPAGSVVLFREPTFWTRYRPYIIGTGAVVALQALMIGALLVQGARRRRVEAALRESDERYALATAAGAVGVWDWNLETGDTYIDPAIGRAMGMADGDTDTHFDSWARMLPVEEAGRLLADAQACLDGRMTFFENEHRQVRGDGSIRWFLIRGSVAQHDVARPTRITGTVMDITDRKRAEANLEEMRHELARMARVTSLAQSAASIAHELSQPLASIQMNIGACLRWLGGSGVPTNELHGALRDMAEAAALANGVITRDREQFRRHTGQKQELDANAIIAEITSLMRTRLQQCGVALDLRLDDTLPPLHGDRVELQQVLLNLLLNGIEAMETVDPRERRLLIETQLTGDLVQTTVQDTGPGIGDTDADRLFTPFYTTKPRGTGIGLSISRFIIERHGGRLWAERSHGRGATFRFTVPVATAQVPGRVPEAAASAPSGGSGLRHA
jgi:PAS domain S-box-containing protein